MSEDLKTKVVDTIDSLIPKGQNSLSLREMDMVHGIYKAKEAVLKLFNAESTEPRWIPVKERNPKGLDEYLVTWETWAVKGARYITVAWYTPDSLGSQTGEWMLPELLRTGYPDPTIVAWMPLPTPWRGEADG